MTYMAIAGPSCTGVSPCGGSPYGALCGLITASRIDHEPLGQLPSGSGRSVRDVEVMGLSDAHGAQQAEAWKLRQRSGRHVAEAAVRNPFRNLRLEYVSAPEVRRKNSPRKLPLSGRRSRGRS